jgi:hypothetical protein
MKILKGFGKNYFTFSAILASSVQQTLHSQVSSIFSLLHSNISKEDNDLEEDPPCELFLVSILETKSYHCNCVYNLKTKLILLSYKYIPRCPFYTTYFAFRRTGVHPPFLIL